LFGSISASTDSLLHLVEGVLGGVEEGLIHGPRVVFGELLDLFGRNWFDVLIKLVRADRLNKVLDSLFDFVVLGLELLGL
jgi:hypothetical protein